jgi:hypothetical protein
VSEELYFNNELRKCLDAAGLSDCGENDEWNYWYQRVHKAHDQAIDRVTEVQRAENAKLRELACHMLTCIRYMEESAGMDVMVGYSPWFAPKLRELGIEVGE